MGQAKAQESSGRLVTLDVIRGIAVMGIFSVNVVGMAMLQFAYFYPPAFGFEGLGDRIMWLLNFLFVDGKLRSLFSILFGASLMLVVEGAVRAGRSPWLTHYARMIVLLVLGWLHWALLWWGDILTHYAAVGMVAVLMWKLRARTLLIISLGLFVMHAAPGFYFFTKEAQEYQLSQKPDAPVEIKKKWEERLKDLKPDAKTLAEDRAEHQSIATRFNAVVPDEIIEPLDLGPLWLETLGLMMLGMAGYKSGFLTGRWDNRQYRKAAALGLGIGFAAYAVFAIIIWRANFAPMEFFGISQVYSPLFRPVMAMGYAALFILMFRRRSALRDRLAAVGRTAFSNYLGCTILGTLLFYGFAGDLYGKLSRGEAWLFVPLVWAAMLWWSKAWLDRFAYGPFEWLWRSLARWKLHPMRKRIPANAIAAEA
ncbi:MAG TPA: DUF418 domain-containing protein [Sphingomicrobium sp.]